MQNRESALVRPFDPYKLAGTPVSDRVVLVSGQSLVDG